MPWPILLRSPWTYVAILFAALGAYAAVQHLGWRESKAEFAQFRADIESEAAKAKVAAAQEAARRSQNATEAVNGVQKRSVARSAVYSGVRARPGSSGMPTVPGTTASPQAGPIGTLQSDPDARCLAALEWGDGQLAGYAELWRLQEANAKR